MIWDAKSQKSVSINNVIVSINSQAYSSMFYRIKFTLFEELSPGRNVVCQDDTAPIHIAKTVPERHEEHSSEVKRILSVHRSAQISISLNVDSSF